MITEKDLHEAIAECQGERNPNAHTCMKLAAYYIILEQMEKKSPNEDAKPAYFGSYSSKQAVIESDTEFAQAANGKDTETVLSLMDELMTTLQVINPRLYEGVMRKLEGWE